MVTFKVECFKIPGKGRIWQSKKQKTYSFHVRNLACVMLLCEKREVISLGCQELAVSASATGPLIALAVFPNRICVEPNKYYCQYNRLSL